jgi:hypothetical protein
VERSSRADPPAWRTPLIVVVVLLAAVAIGLGLAVLLDDDPGTGQASASASASASGLPSQPVSAEPSAAASAGPSTPPGSAEPSADVAPEPVVDPPDGILPPGSVARVLVDGLRVREEPTTGAALVTTLANGELVAIGHGYLMPDLGPRGADGFIWYPVRSLGIDELPPVGSPPFEVSADIGWVAASDSTTPFLELVPPRCTDAEPTLALLQSLVEWERLACYGDRSITIEGVYGCGGCGGLQPGTFTPEWLAHPMNFDLLSVEPQDRIGPFALRFPPDIERPEAASILRVTGHFDDPASAECVYEPGDPPNPIDATSARFYCRTQFVVESIEVLGTDEDFPFG